VFTITVENTFTAQHQLTLLDGQTESLHSHDWIVRTAVSSKSLDQAGLAIDFNDLKQTVQQVLAPFDNNQLEKLTCFQDLNTSAENLAMFLFTKVESLLPRNVKLIYVEVCEAPGCWARYVP
jgi:6-pyruvoyltetrahydropterin/6-carboxytetrahydropterin synthase